MMKNEQILWWQHSQGTKISMFMDWGVSKCLTKFSVLLVEKFASLYLTTTFWHILFTDHTSLGCDLLDHVIAEIGRMNSGGLSLEA
jgi:hypothetical protein